MAADAAGNDLDAVAVPITGYAAVATAVEANVITPALGGAATLALPEDYRRLGLIKQDGGFETADAATGDPIEFWQQGYKLTSGEAESTLKVSLAQNDPIVREIVRGVAPDANGHIFVDASGSNEQYLLLTEEVYKTKAGRMFLERTNGLVRVGTVERDKSERGTVRGWIVTFERIVSGLFGGAHYSEWVVDEPPAAG